MSNIFLCADLHLGHEGTACRFQNKDGTGPMRPFLSAFDMDERLVENWNSTVSAGDKVYVLGDVAMKKIHLNTLQRMNGKKVLIKGNHDIFRMSDYTPFFYDIRAYHKLDSLWLSHIPLHPGCLNERAWATHNVHGHTHDRSVLKEDGSLDSRYVCVSMEHIDYTPISLEDVRKRCGLA